VYFENESVAVVNTDIWVGADNSDYKFKSVGFIIIKVNL
jgi:hypothetical protein